MKRHLQPEKERAPSSSKTVRLKEWVRHVAISVAISSAFIFLLPLEGYMSMQVPQSATVPDMVMSAEFIVEADFTGQTSPEEPGQRFTTAECLFPKADIAKGTALVILPAGTAKRREADRILKEKGVYKSFYVPVYEAGKATELKPSKRYVLFLNGRFPNALEFTAEYGYVPESQKSEVLRLIEKKPLLPPSFPS